ncbi:MAG: IclR family transcriptional regulator [Lachnospiraceae bacterium]
MSQNRTIYRALEIMKYIAHASHPVTLEHICTHFDLPKTSAYVIVSTLVENSFLQLHKTPVQTYTIGLSAYQVGLSYEKNLSYTAIMQEPLMLLANKLEKTAFFAIPNDLEIIYLLKYEPQNPILTTGRVGGTNPIHCTALGKSMLAHYEKSDLDDVLSRATFEAKTKYSVTDKALFIKQLEKVKEQGYAIDMRELSEFSVCYSAPIFNASGTLEGAISVSGLYNPKEDPVKTGQLVRDTARAISKNLGYL